MRHSCYSKDIGTMTLSAQQLFAETAAAWGMPLSHTMLDQFAMYAQELQQWNSRMNLTAVRDIPGIYIRHFLDALRCALAWGSVPDSLIDIGSGAGFPGIPLKLVYPALALTLVESVGKKATFLEHMVTRLDLDNVTILPQRVELVGHNPARREQYDVVTARAVAEVRVLLEYGLPLLRCGGYLLAPKGADVQAEIDRAQSALITLGGHVRSIEPVDLPGLEPRTLVVVQKIAPTPPQYPRAVGIPAHRPL